MRNLFLLLCFTLFSSNVCAKKMRVPCYDKVLLIVHYNHPFYDSIPFIKSLYQETFPNIVFYGEKEHPNVKAVPTHIGWFAQRALYDAIVNNPDYDGYLMLQDDCLLNIWNLHELDPNKIWANQTNTQNLNDYAQAIDLYLHTPTGWWWSKESGQEGKTNACMVKQALTQLAPNYVERLAINAGNKECGFGGWSDCVYLPKRLAENYCEICPFFEDVFIEIALPTIFACLDNQSNMEALRYIWSWDPPLNPKVHWLHPFKFSKRTTRQKIQLYFARYIRK